MKLILRGGWTLVFDFGRNLKWLDQDFFLLERKPPSTKGQCNKYAPIL